MWSQWGSRSGALDNHLPPSWPVRVHDRVCAWVFSDENGQRIVQTDNESDESTTTGHLQDETNPITPCWIFSISFVLIAAMHEQNPGYLFVQASVPPPNPLQPAPSPQPRVNTPMPVSNCLLSLRHSYLQAPGCHCWDDLLNAKWYGV